jgi:hypothetical protein
MWHSKLALIALLSTTPALAGVGGPPIAYTKGSVKGDAIYLVHPDGTGLTKLYQTTTSPRNFGGKIERLAILPGGGEVAFTQDSVLLRVQKHHANGQPNGPAYNVTVPNNRCALGDVDYRADGTLVVSDGCFNVWVVPPGGTAATKLFSTAENIGAVRWMRDGSVLIHSGPLEAMRLRRWSSGTFNTIAPTTYFPPFLGMSRIANETAISDRSTYKVVDLSTGSARAGCKPAGNVRLSPTSSQILYRSSTGYLFVQKADCSGAAYRLAMGVGDALEWRAN